MNIEDLEAFAETAKDMNITAAARRMYISQQALRLKIQRLEKYYGTALFERKPHLHLTYAGEQLLNIAAVILREHQEYKNLTSGLPRVSGEHSGGPAAGKPLPGNKALPKKSAMPGGFLPIVPRGMF